MTPTDKPISTPLFDRWHETPVFVGGMARSGTTMVLDWLNLHPGIAIQAEVPPKAVEEYLAFSKRIDEVYAGLEANRKDGVSDHWQRHRLSLFFSFMEYANKEAINRKEAPSHLGFKTPSAEQFFYEIAATFADRKPRFIYCLRRPDKVWHSIRSFGWMTDFDVFLRKYLRSMNIAMGMQMKYPGQISVFCLDQYLCAEDPSAYAAEKLFEPLGLKIDDAFKMKLAEAPNRNSMTQRGQAPLNPQEIANDLEILRNHEVIGERWFALTGETMPTGAEYVTMGQADGNQR